jgi:hypothetical protein
MFRKTNHGETPSDSAQEAADNHFESGQERPDRYTPTWDNPTLVRRVCRAALVLGQRAFTWTCTTILPPARAAYARWRGSLYPWLCGAMSRLRQSQLGGIAQRHWSRTTPRSRRVVLAVCTVSAAILLLVGIRGLLVNDRPAVLQQRGATAAATAVRIHEVKPPILFHVRVGSAETVCTASAGKRRQMAGAAASRILPVVTSRPEQAVVICLQDLPLSFSLLPAPEQQQFEQRFGPLAAKRYEASVAMLLNATISAIQQQRPHAVLSVLGLPIEPEQAGVSLEIAQRSNERYGMVLDRVGPFVPARRFVVFGTTLDEKLLTRMGMREALRLRDGRPIVFQTNTVWNALVDDKGLDFQEYVVAHASGRIDRDRAASGYGQQEIEVQALLGDDAYWE